jgi:hypothetical protein
MRDSCGILLCYIVAASALVLVYTLKQPAPKSSSTTSPRLYRFLHMLHDPPVHQHLLKSHPLLRLQIQQRPNQLLRLPTPIPRQLNFLPRIPRNLLLRLCHIFHLKRRPPDQHFIHEYAQAPLIDRLSIIFLRFSRLEHHDCDFGTQII